MDIEKPAPAGSIKKPAVAKKAEEPRHHDALDSLLAEEGAKPSPASSSVKTSASRSGLGSILAVDDPNKAAPAAPAAAPATAKKTAAHRHHRR